ncbi:hypothetical protein [Rhodopirellula sp. P2]|uniref:hypothetical protein n=1 Tax=Rhodopirellula sp. P2 TaxID=2127060 RepID=UPI002368787A|nr:hypothetical protein [Rhodopirellula sp. P2]WDQ19021.1 hypothetical protein PSR62_10900 [Rhodopirellula sp. P2]
MKTLNGVAAEGVGHAAAMELMSEPLQATSVTTPQLFATLNSMAQATPRAKNWLRLLASQ